MRLLLATALVALTATTVAQAQGPRRAPVSPLPTGKLQPFAGNAEAINFIAIDQDLRRGPNAEAWVFRVVAKPIIISAEHDPHVLAITQNFMHLKIDCLKRSALRASNDGFDSSGRFLVGADDRRAGPIERDSTQDFLARVLCDNVQLPATNIVIGHEAAVQLANQHLGSSNR